MQVPSKPTTRPQTKEKLVGMVQQQMYTAHQSEQHHSRHTQHPQFVGTGHTRPGSIGDHDWYARAAQSVSQQQSQHLGHQPPTLPAPLGQSLPTHMAPQPTQASASPTVQIDPSTLAVQQKSARSPAAVHNNIDTLVQAAERRAAEKEAPVSRARQASNASSTHHQLQQSPAQTQQQPLPRQQAAEEPRSHHPIDLQQMTLKSPDPVDLLILSEPEARHLFSYFCSELNPLIKILDPFLHTFDYVRFTSTALFTSMLTVASKYHRPDLHAALLNETQHLHGRGQTECQGGIGLIQGMAMLSRKTLRARLYIEEDDEDGAYIPSMVTIDDLDLDKWLDEGQARGIGSPLDRLLCGSVDYAFTFGHMQMAADRLLALAPTPGEVPSSSFMQNRMSWGNVRCRARLAYYEAAGRSDHKALPLYLESVADTFDICITSLESGSLDRVQDVFAVLLFRTAQSLAKLFPTVSFVHQTSIMTMLKCVYEACSKAAKGDDGCTAAYLKRFVRLVIRALTVNTSFPSSRDQTPNGDREGSSGAAAMALGPVTTAMHDQLDGHQMPQQQPPQQVGTQPGFAFQDIIGNIGSELVPELLQGNMNLDPMAGMQSLDAGYWEALLPPSSLAWLDGSHG
ncbi:hypothetical protein OIV83_001264 [Microbotryomycetes sp. JL201]|nr:hypothetical protein OIV83_001264 [Microbotryomycetes sp. JL201]